MAKRQVVEIDCSRCSRKEYREVPENTVYSNADDPAFSARFGAIHVVFDDLCAPCQRTVSGHLDSIRKKIEGVSPVRQKRTKEATVHPVAKKKTHAAA